MALRIPVQQGPQVDPTVAPTVRSQPTMGLSNFGGGAATDAAFGQARGMANDVQRIAMDAEDRAQEAQFNELTAKLGAEEVRLKKELAKVRGKDVLPAATKTYQDWDKSVQDISKGATSERVRARLAQASGNGRLALQRFVEPYTQKELENYEGSVVEEHLKAEENAAIQSFADPFRVAMAHDEQERTLRRYAQKTGKPPEWAEGRIAESRSRINRGVVNQFLAAGDDLSARNYFNENKDGFLGSDQIAVKGALEEGSYLGQSQREEDRIMASAKTEEEALAEARKLKDPKLREMTGRRLEHRFSNERRLESQAYETRVEGAVKRITEKWNPDNIRGIPTVEDVVGAPEWDALKDKDRAALGKIFRQVNGLEAIDTDPRTYTRLYGLSAQELAGYSETRLLTEFGTKLSPQDYQEAVKLWKAARDTRSPEKFNGLISDNDMILSSMAGVGLGGIKKGDTLAAISGEKADQGKAEMYALFRKAVDAKLQAEHAVTGKNADDKKKREIIEKLALDWGREVTTTGGFSSWGRGYTRPTEDTHKVKLGEFVRDPEMAKRETIVMAPETRADFFNYARSVPGLLPRGMSQHEFESKHRDRINLAYLSKLAGADDARVAQILEGK
jgi:hypothetical protein